MAQRANQTSQAKQNSQNTDQTKLTFLEHFYELRKRLFWIVLTLVGATLIGLQIKDQLTEIVVAPLRGEKLVYLTPGGGFNFIFTISLYFGLLIAIPVIIYQIYQFLQPTFQNTSRRLTVSFISISVLLAIFGVTLAYYLAIPASLGFLDEFTGSQIVSNLTADAYLNFVVSYTVGLAALFQLPLLLFLFDHVRPFPPGTLAKSQRYAIVAITILAALMTPSPDLINYAIVLFPILFAYEAGVFAVYMRRRLRLANKTNQKSKESEKSLDVHKNHHSLHDTILHTHHDMPLTAVLDELLLEKSTHTTHAVKKHHTRSVKPTAVSMDIRPQKNHPKIKAQPVLRTNGRSIEGLRRTPSYPSHRTNLSVPTRQVQAQPRTSLSKNRHKSSVEKSIDGFLTAGSHA